MSYRWLVLICCLMAALAFGPAVAIAGMAREPETRVAAFEFYLLLADGEDAWLLRIRTGDGPFFHDDLRQARPFLPFGEQVKGDRKTPFTFTGLRREGFNGSGDDLLGASYRHLRPGLGRWVKRDPAGTVDGPNLYRYVRNAPLVYVDVPGLSAVPVTAGAPALTLISGAGGSSAAVSSGSVAGSAAAAALAQGLAVAASANAGYTAGYTGYRYFNPERQTEIPDPYAEPDPNPDTAEQNRTGLAVQRGDFDFVLIGYATEVPTNQRPATDSDYVHVQDELTAHYGGIPRCWRKRGGETPFQALDSNWPIPGTTLHWYENPTADPMRDWWARGGYFSLKLPNH